MHVVNPIPASEYFAAFTVEQIDQSIPSPCHGGPEAYRVRQHPKPLPHCLSIAQDLCEWRPGGERLANRRLDTVAYRSDGTRSLGPAR